jgi:hypothetical protein
MSKSAAILKWLLMVAAAYFFAVAITHMIRIKIPILFIYYNVSSYGYQDTIISFLSFGWSIFIFTASIDPMKNRNFVKAILLAGLVAIFGLNVINQATDFHALSPDIHPAIFRKEVLVLSVYEAILIIFYFLAKREKQNE